MEAGVGVVTLEQQLVADVDGSVASLYLSEAAALLGMLWMYIGDRAAPEDLVQEAFVGCTVRGIGSTTRAAPPPISDQWPSTWPGHDGADCGSLPGT